MRTAAAALLIALSACASAPDGWKRYPFDGGHFDLNLAAVEGDGPRRATVRMVLNQPRTDPSSGQQYDSGVLVQEHDCRASRFRVVESSFYSGARQIAVPRTSTTWLPPNRMHRDICATSARKSP